MPQGSSAPEWTATLSYRHVKLDERFPGNAVEILDDAGEYASIAANIDRIFFYDIEQAVVEGTALDADELRAVVESVGCRVSRIEALPAALPILGEHDRASAAAGCDRAPPSGP